MIDLTLDYIKERELLLKEIERLREVKEIERLREENKKLKEHIEKVWKDEYARAALKEET